MLAEVVKSLLAAAPISVFLGCRRLADGEEVIKLLIADGIVADGQCRAVQINVSDPSSIAAAVTTVSTMAPTLDILVNNAGILLEGNGPVSVDLMQQTMDTNFYGVVNVTEAFLPLMNPGCKILNTSSGVGGKTIAKLSESDRVALTAPTLTVEALEQHLASILESLQDPQHEYHRIPTVGYGLSKLGVNCYTQILARERPEMFINACSPGLTATKQSENYAGPKTLKAPELGASVFVKVLLGELGQDQTGMFFKEASSTGTAVADAKAVVEPWVADIE